MVTFGGWEGPSYDNKNLLRTEARAPSGMWCENCERTTLPVWLRVTIYRNGREVEAQKCGSCGAVQETEYFKGPTTRLKNR